MGAQSSLKSRAPEASPDEIAVCSGPGCGVLMIYREHRLPGSFLALRASFSRCVGCTKHGGKGPDGSRTAAVIEDVEFLLAVGENAYQIAPRVGYRSLPTMYRLLKRRGREDLIVGLLASVADADPLAG